MYSNGKNVTHSGSGRLAGNLITFAVFFVLFVGAIYSLSFWTLENAWLPTIACFVLTLLAFAVPMTFMGRGDSHEVSAQK
ncbi:MULTISPECIES: hypothetical protein [Glutamicibacter]|uniref:hypothetical protein n=1 Tax=Glutamicibacter sp. PS TaxID=3075634 RepID=UPI002840DEE8|nr:hypothetical protein [Glutamicibacter sp. PS]MDR4533584.1 hypothetical protein [Glutamicibacter sp. PS]